MNTEARSCKVCGVEIPRARMEAMPRTVTCVPCQEEIENRVESSVEPDAFGAGEREPGPEVSVDGGLVKLGGWSGGLMEVAETTSRVRVLVVSGQHADARSLVQAMPDEAQAALVALDEDPEQMLSLTAMGEDGRPSYRREVVSLLPTETIAGMVAVRPDERVYNTSLIRAMTPQTFRRTVEETLMPVDDQRVRGRVSWQWLEAVAALNDPNHAAALLRGADPELLEDALVDRLRGRDLNKVMGGIPVFRFFSGDGAGTMRPSHFVGGGRVGSVLDVLYDAAPDLMRLVMRHAWERSAGGEDVFSVAKKEDEVEEEGDEEKDEAGEDGDISLLRRME